ncbi:MAG: glutamate racemase [Oscillospiraceae bacterium]|nr:glutamate racemase [Oscillospiraceae bacterium]MCD7786633.1 glutamate racemase [Oscillospiraceae bacterium]MCD7852739.1 glutamate racemase [Oscillospiraceae bacterium]MCD8255794.1 glutamate racemase [Oscillospiraceae bacterium]
MDRRPIGIFDSGLGGLTAARTLEQILPGETMVYFGDSINAPYGTRSRAELLSLATANTEFLLGFDVKAILIACGTVSSNVLDALAQRFPDVPFFGVLDAACRSAAAASRTGRIAVTATEATIRSGAFGARLRALRPDADVFSKPCQSLVETVEQGHFGGDDPVAAAAVAQELAPVRAYRPDTLLLACTHFPLLEREIADYMGAEVQLLSVAEETAKALRDYLCAEGRCTDAQQGAHRWFTSGGTEEFARYAALFLGHEIVPEYHRNRPNGPEGGTI